MSASNSELVRPARRAPVLSEILESRTLLSTVPSGFTDTTVASGLFSPTAMDIAPDGSGRIFVTEQTGKIRVIKDGQLITQPFATLNVTSFGEHGLLGITFDPNFASNQFVYVYYTTAGSQFHNRLSRFTATGDVATGAETVLFDSDDLDSTQLFHDGGGLHFGPDGKLYISTGENQHPENSQSLSTLQGKLLRLNADGSIPADNPFFGSTTGKNRAIYAYGFRNPFTYAFQPGSGTLFVNDVGNDLFEEINQVSAGGNFGWPQQEGSNGAGQNGITDPIFFYDHGVGNAITGGVFYPTSGQFPAQYLGKYFFSDIGGGWIHILDPGTHQQTDFATDVLAPVDLDLGDDGALYYLGRQSDGDIQQATGFVSVIRNASQQAPIITTHPQDKTVANSASASFSVQATGSTPLSYQWRRNGQDIAGANSATFTINPTTPADDGAQFDVVVSNSFGSDTSNPATLTVINDQPPVPKIITPLPKSTFFAGQTISFSGKATDPEEGNLGSGRFTWQVDYYTGGIVRPFVQPITGIRSGTFTIPTITPYTKSNVFYRIILKVKDSQGITATTTRDIGPLKANVTVQTNIPGGKVKIDGQDSDATTFNGVVGIEREVGADATQVINGRTYTFDHWSDGGDLSHQISTPTADATYMAVYASAVQKGLKATYFNNRNFSGTQFTRYDNQVKFNWGLGSPDPVLIGRDTFSAIWNGKFQAVENDTYNFAVVTEGGVRLRVNGQVVINSLSPKGRLRKAVGSIDLAGGQKYNLILEYVHATGTAQIDLRYSTSTVEQQTIGRGLLYPPPALSTTLQPIADAFVQGGALADTNFGDAASLLVKERADEAFVRDTYLKFDLTDIQVITKVRLRVFGALSSVANANVPTGVFSAESSDWEESTLTFNNRPAAIVNKAEALVSVHSTQQWWEFDVTSFVRAEKSLGRDVVTLVLRNLKQTTATTAFASKEAGTNGPELIVAS